MTKIMIVGQKWLAEQLLNYCISQSVEVVAVAAPSEDDRLAKCAHSHNIPVRITPKQFNAADVMSGTDLILCAHAHCYISKEARLKSRLGALGYHPSLLPKYRGRNAIQDMLDNNEILAGGSLYWLDDGWDTGEIYLQKSCEILPSQTAKQLWQQSLAPIGLTLFQQALANLT